MKNIIKIVQILLVGLSVAMSSAAQLPLKFGDAVVTHSPNSYTISGPTTSPAVVRIIHSSNTTSAPLGATWTVPPKPANDFYPNWNVNILGYVFGITLDQNTNPNIYVSSTQIYASSTLNQRKVWRLNGSSGPGIGGQSLVFDFNNPSGTGTATSTKSLGNLKYCKIGGIENIYVSDWENGHIKRLTGNSASTVLWANQSPFSPLFGKLQKDPREMPYGLAVRKMPGGTFKLYYAKTSTNSNSNSIGGYGNNEIWSVDLNAVGDFVIGTETQQIIPVINRPPSSWNGYVNPPPLYTCNILPVIADIAFTNNGKKMLVGQQSWGVFGLLAPHNSEVKEFVNTPLPSTTWVASGNIFPSGQSLSVTCSGSLGGYANAVGGVSYSDNILRRNDQSFGCDTAVYFTADYINVATGSNTVYGVQGMNANGGLLNSISNSIWIDEDDNLAYYDKIFLGDVEVYKKPDACAAPCQCGRWDSIGYNNNSHWWLNNTAPPPLVPPISFNQGAATGVLFPYYTCNGGPCSATFTYQLISNTGTSTTISGSPTGGLDLAQPAINNLACGSYFLNITPTCGNITCPPIRIPIVIICPAACEPCAGNTTITQGQTNVTTQNNISNPNPVSTAITSFTLTSSVPLTEVRVLIDEFRITTSTGNENCLLCRNKPQTWANINAGSLSGVSFQPMASPATFPPALEKDIRELVFNNGPGTFFNLSGNTLNLMLGVPGVTGLNCCTLKAELCIKFIIRDVNCCEKEILKCFTFNL